MKLGENDYEDNTDGIRRLKHSDLIISDMKKMIELKKENAMMRENNPIEFSSLCQTTCSFLYNAYTDIFNRLYKDELDVELMFEALKTLKQIEDGKVDQHEGSFMVGKLLKELYIDSALKKSEKLDAVNKKKKGTKKKELKPKEITWNEYKQKGLSHF